jgi:hypothetical protein
VDTTIYTPVKLQGGRYDGQASSVEGSPAYITMVTPAPVRVVLRQGLLEERPPARAREDVYVRTADFTPDMRRIYQLKADT